MRPYIKISGLYKIFGHKPGDGVTLLAQGENKETLLKQYNLSVGLNDVSLDINKGETFIVMGLSGSGKSTLIRHFNRLIEPTAGKIEVDGVDVCSLNKKDIQQLRRHKMSMVFQRFGLFPHKTVIQNVAYGLKVQGISNTEAMQKAAHWLEVVGLTGYEKQYPNQLSGGQQQRVGLARALCTDPDILLMDEAFSALDPLIRSEMQLQLKALQQKLHKTIIFITHDLDEALRLGDRIAILKDGELVQQGKPVDILFNPQTEYVASFVKDINRSRALTVQYAYTPMKGNSINLTLQKACEILKQQNMPCLMLSDEHQTYLGTLLQTSLLEVLAHKKAKPDQTLADLLEFDLIRLLKQPIVSIEQSIEAILPQLLQQNLPLPVNDQDEKLIGLISPNQLGHRLTGKVA